ncbi:ankyrin repeat domain-containing protein [Lucifera butyrica]|uniref:ankyrin repeat domain-containing protein n=1 Tax=Lucifera butyrica TaxID=1351585 RepID=UPI00140306C6|nr:ankyrin repeat domain-containing protein [Lucifera butyrica]
MFTLFMTMELTAANGAGSGNFIDAVQKGDMAKIQILLQAGADVNQRDEREKTPLIIAVENGNLLLTEELIAWGADLNVPDAWDNTPLLIAARKTDNNMLHILLNAKANPDLSNKNSITPLIASVQRGNTGAVKMLLEYRANINAQDSLGRTALMWAVSKKNEALVRLLLENGADARIADRENQTALTLAEQEHSGPEILLLLKEGLRNRPAQAVRPNSQPAGEYTGQRRIFQPAIEPGRLLIGNPKAPVTIVEYTDLQCPYCAEGARLMKDTIAAYGDRVRVIVKNNPLPSHRQAILAALYFEAMVKQDPDKALAFLDSVFSKQDELKEGEPFLKAVALVDGADPAELQRDISSADIKNIVAADLAEAGKFHFDGVPVFLVNGRPLYGVPARTTLFHLVDAILASG